MTTTPSGPPPVLLGNMPDGTGSPWLEDDQGSDDPQQNQQ